MDKIKLDTVEEAIASFRQGEFVVVVDDEDRENEGDLIIAAELITPEKVNRFTSWTTMVFISMLVKTIIRTTN